MSREIPIISFENWILTARGKRCMDMKGLTEEYLKNRLWWAFHAGNSSKQVWMTSEIQSILESLVDRQLPRSLNRRIRYVLDNKEDYSLQHLHK